MKKRKEIFWKRLLAVLLSAVIIAASMPEMYISASEAAVESNVVVYDELPEEPTTVVEVFSEDGEMEKIEAEIEDFQDVPDDQSAVGGTSSTVTQISDLTSEDKEKVSQTADLNFAYKDLINNGSDSDNFCILIAGDGYTASEQDKFLETAQRIADYFLTKSPFNEAAIRGKINIRAVCVVSNQSGVSMDPNNLYDSFFKSSFNNAGIERLICIHDQAALDRVVQQYMPDCNVPIVVGNSTVYGGSGGSVCVLSAHEASTEIAVHEFGHTGAGLADEYWETTTADSNGYEAPNRTADSNPYTCKWADLIGVNGVGLYAFDENPAWYRPHQNCEMRYLNAEFCEVCKRQLRNSIGNVVNNKVGDNEIIYTAEQLITYANKVAAGAKTYNKTVTLANDITLSGTNNLPVMGEFNGTFNGNGHKISGININSGSGTAGFIGTLGSSGTVMNLAIENANIVGNGYYVGGIVGDNKGTIYQCSFSGYANGYSGTGGIAGHNEGTVRDCYNRGSIYSTSQVSGGIVGWMDGGSVYNCYNYGNISVGNSWYGAVCGYRPNGSISNCYYLAGTAGEGVAGEGDNGASSRSSNDFANGTVTSQLNAVSNVWKQGDGIPVFSYTSVSYNDGLTDCVQNTNTLVSYWGYYVGEWAGATARYAAGSGWDPITLKVTANGGGAWGVQLFTAPVSVTAGSTYNIYITLNSDKAGASVLFKEDTTDTNLETRTLVAGDNTFSGTFTATGDTAEFFFDLGAVTAGSTVKTVSIAMAEVAPETTTEAPTEPSDGMTECTLDQNVTVGKWGYYVGAWAPATARYLGGTELNDFTLKVTSNAGAAWGVQAFTAPIAVNPGSQYTVRITLNSDTAGASVLFKEDVTDTTFETKTLVAGDNAFTGTYTPTGSEAKFFFDLGAVAAGTTAKVTSFSLTEEKPAETTTTPPVITDWMPVDASNGVYEYRNATNIEVVNVQQPGFATAQGIYMSSTEAIGRVTINDVAAGEDTVAIQGAGTIVYLTALNAEASKICLYSTTGALLGSVELRYNAEAETTTEPPTEPIKTIDGGIEINGYQISATVGGMRTVYSVDSEIDGKKVVSSGIIYSLSDYAAESEMYVGSTSKYVRSYASTSAGISDTLFTDSDIATTYAMTMKFGAGTVAEYNAGWRIRAYAQLEDGTYVYTKTYSYKIYDIADELYQTCMMNTKEQHEYLYNNILLIVNKEYKAVDYDWSNTIIGA